MAVSWLHYMGRSGGWAGGDKARVILLQLRGPAWSLEPGGAAVLTGWTKTSQCNPYLNGNPVFY